MGSVITFAVALGAIVLFFTFKVFEQTRTLGFYRRARVAADKSVMRAALSLERRIQYIEERMSLHGALRSVAHRIVASIAMGARVVEEHALAATRRLSRPPHYEGATSNSPFLQEVASHKSSLDTERIKRETSLADAEEASDVHVRE